ncbi:hypothetical protein HPB50_009735 [Hyalomma asiaticum]|uniref:Uncharacterized protein n=1 Tax=Hyalomma asiaticum TaxID=266040 RepID=A0ACB7TFE2_HYAAI|nr:hypothetical protein HPB50_009735 [Hyalomma asiaticum]
MPFSFAAGGPALVAPHYNVSLMHLGQPRQLEPSCPPQDVVPTTNQYRRGQLREHVHASSGTPSTQDRLDRTAGELRSQIPDEFIGNYAAVRSLSADFNFSALRTTSPTSPT